MVLDDLHLFYVTRGRHLNHEQCSFVEISNESFYFCYSTWFLSTSHNFPMLISCHKQFWSRSKIKINYDCTIMLPCKSYCLLFKFFFITIKAPLETLHLQLDIYNQKSLVNKKINFF